VVTTSRPRSKRGEGDALRDALLGAASRLLDASGDVDGLSVRAVTAAAGVSPTALYLHFGDKAALVHAVKIECLAEMSTAVRAARSAHDGDPDAELVAMGVSYLRYAEEHPGHYAMLFHTEVSADERAEPPEDVQRASRAALHLIFEVLRQRLNGPRAQEATMTFWTGLHGRAHLRKALPWVDLGDQGRYLASLVAQALRS
jgi:AcrR family transcriptional regulator